MEPSPYTPGAAPLVLAGRVEQRADGQADIARVATFGRFSGRIRVDVGPRGVGKTSLLKALRDDAASAGLVTSWVTARADESLVGQLVDGVRRGLDAIGIDLVARRGVRDRLRSLRLEIGAGVAKAGVEVDVSPGDDVTAPAASAALGQVLSEASAAARERGSGGLCLLVDEVQAARVADLRTLAYAWQELQGAVPEPAAVLFAAGLPDAPDVLTDAVTFSERFAFRPLGALTDDEAAEALTVPARAAEVTWDEELLRTVLDEAQGYPYLLQLWGDAVWRTAGPSRGATMGPEVLGRARQRVSGDLDSMFRARWAKATPGERRLLVAMAELAVAADVTVATDGRERAVRRGSVAERMGVGTNEISMARRSLLDKGLVEVAGRGLLAFTTPGFAAYVLAEAGADPHGADDR